MCEVVSKKMLATVRTAKLYGKAGPALTALAARHDCEGMWLYVIEKTTKYREIDEGMRASGKKPLADVKAELELLYREHQKNAKNARPARP